MFRRFIYLVLCVLCVISSSACSKLVGAENSDMIFDGAKVDYSAELEENTPERLAQLSADTYKQMINGEISPEEGFIIMISHVPEDNVSFMQEQRIEFINQIRSSSEFFEEQEVTLESFVFSKTFIDKEKDGHASIYRIQIMSNGRMYYFRQDFIIENDVWRIRGDNLVNDFAIRVS